MQGDKTSYPTRRTAPRPRPGATSARHATADEDDDLSRERRPSRPFNALAFTRAEHHESTASPRRRSVTRSAGPALSEDAPPPLDAHVLVHAGHTDLEEELAAQNPFLASPPEDGLLSPPTRRVGPLVTEAWARSVLKPGDECLLYESRLPASGMGRPGQGASGATTTSTTNGAGPGRRVLYRWPSQDLASRRGPAPAAQGHGSGGYSARWRYGVSTQPSAETNASVYAQLGRLGRLSAASTMHTAGSHDSHAPHVASSVSVMPNDRHVPRLFSRPSYQEKSARPSAVMEQVASSSWGTESLSRPSDGASQPFGAEDAGMPFSSSAEHGTQLLQHTRELLLERLRASQGRQGAPVTTEAYPMNAHGTGAGGHAMMMMMMTSTSTATTTAATGVPITSLMRADVSAWTTRGEASTRRRRPNLDSVVTLSDAAMTTESAAARAKDVARAVAYEPILVTTTATTTTTASASQTTVHTANDALVSRVGATAEAVLVNDPFFPLTSEENYERLLLQNDEYEHRLAFKAAWVAQREPPAVSPFRPRYTADAGQLDGEPFNTSGARRGSVSTRPSEVQSLIAPFGYHRATESVARTASEAPSATMSESRPSVVSTTGASRLRGSAVAIKLARKPRAAKTAAPSTTTAAPTKKTAATTTTTGASAKPAARHVVPTTRPTATTTTTAPATTTVKPSKTAPAVVARGERARRPVKATPPAKKLSREPCPPPLSADVGLPIVPGELVSATTTPQTSPTASAGAYVSVADEVAALLARHSPPPLPVALTITTSATATAEESVAVDGTPQAEKENSPERPAVVRTPRRPSLDSTTVSAASFSDMVEDALVVDASTPERPPLSGGGGGGGGSGSRRGVRSGLSATGQTGLTPPTPTLPLPAAGVVSPSVRILADAVMPSAGAGGAAGGGGGSSTPVRRAQRPATSLGYVSPVNAMSTMPLASPGPVAAAAASTSTSAGLVSASPSRPPAVASAAGATTTTTDAAPVTSSTAISARPSPSLRVRPGTDLARRAVAAFLHDPAVSATASATAEPLPLERQAAEAEAGQLAAAAEDVLAFSLGPWEGPFPTTRLSEGSTDAALPPVPPTATDSGVDATEPSKYGEELRLYIAYYLRHAEADTGALTAAAPTTRLRSRESLINAVREDLQTGSSDVPPADGSDDEDWPDLLDDGSDHERNVQCVLDVFGLAWQSPTLFAAPSSAAADASSVAAPVPRRPAVVAAVEALFARPTAAQ